MTVYVKNVEITLGVMPFARIAIYAYNVWINQCVEPVMYALFAIAAENFVLDVMGVMVVDIFARVATNANIARLRVWYARRSVVVAKVECVNIA